MGIPRLKAILEVFAVYEVLRDCEVVIDGPALAYHILHVCRAKGMDRPSYDSLGREVLSWLDELEEQRVTIRSVYFDGFLPSPKQTIRMERMIKGTSRLNRLFSAYQQGCPSSLLVSKGDLNGGFVSSKVDSKHLFDPSFLVPAILDALRLSNKYKNRCYIIPGEADVYCAQDVARHSGIVMTSDSDLLAYELDKGKVAFLKDIYKDVNSRMVCATFDPRNIYIRLGLPKALEICRFGYELKRTPNATLSGLVRACFRPPVDPNDYQTFCQQYHDYGKGHHIPYASYASLLSLNQLDPRVSELFLQLGSCTPILNQPDPRALIFLPILIESPQRRSAWESGARVRRLAYSVARWAMQNNNSVSVQEFRRVQSLHQQGRQIDIIPSDEIINEINNLLIVAGQVQESQRGGYGFWVIFCLIMDIIECEELGKYSHALYILRQAEYMSAIPQDNISWDLVHLQAQLDAGLYSLRILKQALSISPRHDTDGMVSSLIQIRALLFEMPPLSGYPDADEVFTFLKRTGSLQLTQLMTKFVEDRDIARSKAPRVSADLNQSAANEIRKLGITKEVMTNCLYFDRENPFDALAKYD